VLNAPVLNAPVLSARLLKAAVPREGEAPAPSDSHFRGEKKAKPRFELRKGKTSQDMLREASLKETSFEDASAKDSKKGTKSANKEVLEAAPLLNAPLLNAPVLKAAAPADTDAGSSNGSDGSSTPSMPREISLAVSTETAGIHSFEARMAALGLADAHSQKRSSALMEANTVAARRDSRADSDGALPAADEAELNRTMPGTVSGIVMGSSTARRSSRRGSKLLLESTFHEI